MLFGTAGALLACALGLGLLAETSPPEVLVVTGYGSFSNFGGTDSDTVNLTGSALRLLDAAVGTLREAKPRWCAENADVFFFQDIRNGNAAWTGADVACGVPGGWVGFGHRSFRNSCPFLTEIASIFPMGQATASKQFVRQWCGPHAAAVVTR
jgi:hypothetical protein